MVNPLELFFITGVAEELDSYWAKGPVESFFWVAGWSEQKQGGQAQKGQKPEPGPLSGIQPMASSELFHISASDITIVAIAIQNSAVRTVISSSRSPEMRYGSAAACLRPRRPRRLY